MIRARLYPNDFAAGLMKTDGYTAVVAGKVIYLVQCRAVYVKIASLSICYQEMPVLRDDKLWYMTHMTRILQKEGSKIECSSFLAPKYKFGITDTRSLKSGLRANWTYTYIPDLMNTGIYSKAKEDQMREVIYDNSMYRSATNYLKNLLEGYQVQSSIFNVKNIIPIARYWSKWLRFASWIGHFTTTIIGFWMLAKAS